MTALGDASENWDETTPPSPVSPCYCEERHDVARNDRKKYKMIFFASFQWLVLSMMIPKTENENH